MRDDLLLYYERELSFLRQSGAAFAKKYPKIASRLALEPDKCEDPHVERMLEGFALLAGRIHLKIDDNFPEVTEALLNAVYPHYLRPIPSMSIAEFDVDPGQIKPQSGLEMKRGATLLSRPVDGIRCRFQTCYDLTFWPVVVTGAEWRAGAASRSFETAGTFSIHLQTQGGIPFSKLALNSLRFFINGESELAYTVYELVSNNCTQMMLRDGNAKAAAILPASSLRASGFGAEEAALPYGRRSFAGYRIVQEYLSFPQKFLFFEVNGLGGALKGITSERVELQISIAPFERAERRFLLEGGVSERTFRLWCTPVINLFPQTAEPILLDHSRTEYPIVPDATVRQAMEVFSIEEVLSADAQTQEVIRFEPFHSLRHGVSCAPCYWQASRRILPGRSDALSEMLLSIVDKSGHTFVPEARSLTVRTMCTNADLPGRLNVGHGASDFELEGAVAVKRISTLIKPSQTLRPPAAKDALWRLISQLSLNYLSLVEDGGDALREMLHLYNFAGSTYLSKQIDGLISVRSRRHFAPLPTGAAVSFARGTQVEIEFDEEQFVGGGVYLFAAVIESFLSQYVSMNSFCQLLARTRQRKEALKLWPARAGRKVLL